MHHRRDDLVKRGLEQIPAKAAGEFEMLAEGQRVDNVNPERVRHVVYVRGDGGATDERVAGVRREQRGGWQADIYGTDRRRRFAADFKSGDQRVMDETGVEPNRQVCLVLQKG